MSEQTNGQPDKKGKDQKKRHRSPNFPAIGLKKAVERTQEVYAKAKTFDMMESIAHTAWGYKVHSSGGFQTTAALKAFGLITSTGSSKSRKIKVSDEGRRIILKADDRDVLLQKAAQRPKVHQQIFDHFGQVIPPDDVLRQFLIFDLEFNEESVGSFMSQFRETISFAKLTDDVILGETEDEEEDGESGDNPEVPAPGKSGIKHPIPPRKDKMSDLAQNADFRELRFLLPSGNAVLFVPQDMSDGDFDVLSIYLEAFKKGASAKRARLEEPEEEDEE